MTETKQRFMKGSDISKDFKYEVSKIHGGEKLLNCLQCGTCTSDCPIARFSDTYRPRQLIRMTQIGLRDKVLSSDSLWLCASCFTCTDRCPQDVEVANVIRVLRNLAAQQALIPKVFKQLGATILETGYAYRIPELRLKKREDLELPPLPKGSSESLNKVLSKVHFRKVIGKDR
ncbi:MAG: 4Fe-4S dicluster domain-containing protein [Candidatus Bathyarchaeota archaeon]|nr:4Fe-4S dicluster domain-containing protein [Candidatus Bathyarchaeota archaeon]